MKSVYAHARGTLTTILLQTIIEIITQNLHHNFPAMTFNMKISTTMNMKIKDYRKVGVHVSQSVNFP